MLSKLGKRLRALVRGAETEPGSKLDVTETVEPNRLAATYANRDTPQQTHELAQIVTATRSPKQEDRQTLKLALETPYKPDDAPEPNSAPEADGTLQNKQGSATVLSEEPTDCLEAEAKSDDDLTALALVSAINEPHRATLPTRKPGQTLSNSSQGSGPTVSYEFAEDERLLDLAIKSIASTRLINFLRNAEIDLPVTTLNSYMLAPDAARESFEQLKNFGWKSANELDRVVRKYAAEKHALEINRKKWDDAPDSIVEVIREADCSVRLFNAITANSDRLPVNTVQDYMSAPEHARNSFLKLPNLGRKSATELDQIMRSVASFSQEVMDKNDGAFDVGTTYKRAMQAAEVFFSGLRYPEELFEWSPATRLANLLKIDQVEHQKNFADFLKTYDETAMRIRSLPNCGRKSIEELDRIVTQLIEARLIVCGVDKEIETYLRRLLRGEMLSQPVLARIIELGNLKPEDIQASETASIEDMSVAEIILASVSTLDERQQDILQRRYGIEKDETETLEQVATSYDVTRERIRQIEKKAKQKIATKRTVKILVAALEQEDTLETLFKDRKIVSEEQIGIVSKSLKAEESLAVDLAYGDLRSFLDAESVWTETGWVQEKDLLLMTHEPENLSGSLRQRIVSAIGEQHLPIRLSKVASSIPDYSLSVIKDELSENLGASFEGDTVSAVPRLPSSVRCILILREAGHAMHCDEIRARMHEVFGKDESIGQIGNTLARLEDALIVERGTYDLYENLDLTDNDLAEIRDRTLRHLEAVGGFVSAKVLFSNLFQGETERFGIAFGPYMLLGILQDDKRFETKRGLMIGIASEDNETEFRGLSEDVLAVLSEAKRSMTLVEIAEELEGRRDVLTTSISIGLENSPEAVSVGRGRFDLTERAIGQDERQADLKLACAISLADGPKTAFALSEILSSVWGEIQKRPLLSFLRNCNTFEVDQNIVSIVELPEIVAEYIDVRNQVPRRKDTGSFDLEAIREALRTRGASNLMRLDHLFADKDKDEADGNEEMLGMILGDFGLN
ncbi:hypothetical protein GS634_08090 [Ruegeria atlantica]|uniref:RNA polymerase sigma-70 domain-containing protein n=1 Tax=Ruegeria atlantica TaxID=81569 RepID=A0AA90Z1J1_9RHOB|nr:sigma factor-like helix-turn-helix DNA-binding protein [Ruegeria atlantica]NOE18082.1 hypothetical protein [Ruegeria atlantica]